MSAAQKTAVHVPTTSADALLRRTRRQRDDARRQVGELARINAQLLAELEDLRISDLEAQLGRTRAQLAETRRQVDLLLAERRRLEVARALSAGRGHPDMPPGWEWDREPKGWVKEIRYRRGGKRRVADVVLTLSTDDGRPVWAGELRLWVVDDEGDREPLGERPLPAMACPLAAMEAADEELLEVRHG